MAWCYAGMGNQPFLRLLLALCLASIASIAQGSEFSITSEGRRRLLEAHTGAPLPGTLKRVDTGLSSRLTGGTPGGTPGTGTGTGTPLESIQGQDQPQLRGLRVAFYDRLDETRTLAERDYIMNKLMPATATVLSRSMRVRQPSGKLPLAGYPDENREPIPGDPSGAFSKSFGYLLLLLRHLRQLVEVAPARGFSSDTAASLACTCCVLHEQGTHESWLLA